LNSHNTQPFLVPLTGIRAIAALWVLLYHLQHAWQINFKHPVSLPIVDHGYLAVDLFFVLSGFIIAYVHRAEFRLLGDVRNAPRFVCLRLARLAPVYYVTLLLFALLFLFSTVILKLTPDDTHKYSASGFLYNLLLVQSWGLNIPSVNSPAWSISVECFAYLCFPLLSPVLHRLKSRLSNYLTACGLIMLFTGCYFWIGTGNLDWRADFGLVRVFFEFALGCIGFNIFNLTPHNTTCSGLTALVFMIVLLLAWVDSPWIIDVCFPVLFAVLIVCLALTKQGLFYRLFSNRVITLAGKCSFSLYLFHQFPITVFTNLYERFQVFSPVTCSIVIVISSILGSLALFWWVEEPSRRFLRRYIDRYFPANSPHSHLTNSRYSKRIAV
jgi:peptidoglycan/LPS O-acetylase OafA/YrhL